MKEKNNMIIIHNNIKCKKRGTERKNNCKNKNQKNNCDDMSSIKCEKKKKKE